MRTIQAPGIEINEIDRSRYDSKPDYSLQNAPACFICGFADKGEDYTTQWINSKNTLINTFGYPTTEEETYFYNAGINVLASGGICLMAKLPYDNQSKDHIPYCEYRTNGNTLQSIPRQDDLKKVDSTLSTYVNFVHNAAGIDTISNYDNYNTDRKKLTENCFRIYGITKKQYDKLNVVDSAGRFSKKEILGILPVVTFSKNAMFFQNIISAQTITDGNGSGFTTGQQIQTQGIEKYNQISEIRTTDNGNLNLVNDNFSIWLSSDYIEDQTISRDSAKMFPAISYLRSDIIDRKYLRYVGITVFELYKDVSSGDRVNFRMLESFYGSFKKGELDPTTKKNMFIDDVVNQNSNYINIFSNIRSDILEADVYSISEQPVYSLGFTEEQSKKEISFINSIQKPLNMIFDQNSDPNIYQLDLLLDAGISTIANRAKGCDINKSDCSDSQSVNGWSIIVQKFDEFCRYQRKDCVFLMDAPKKFCLDNDQKKVRKSVPSRTVQNTIIPQLKNLMSVNSSYSAGYCDWFYTPDAYTGELFWCPPSIKAAGVYIDTDVYAHKWDAPAGLNRGVIRDAVDCAFSPTNDEAGQIYNASWNYAVNYPLDGITIEGQHTMQRTPTALDRVNVRRLMLHLERNVVNRSRYFKYEANTAYNRQRFVDQVRPILEDAKTGYGIIDYAVKCDETNNTQQTIENHELHCSIAVKPVKTIEFIVLNFICTNQSASVSEEIVK